MLPVRCACGIRHRVPWRLGGKTLRCKCGPETRIPAVGQWLAIAVLAWGVLTTLAIQLLSDRWLPATALAFGPRWVLLVPCFLVIPVLAWLSPRLTAAPVGAALLVAWAAMGWSWGLSRHFVPTSGTTIRVMTYTVEGGLEVSRHLGALLERWSPEVTVFEECGDSLSAGLAALQAGPPGRVYLNPVTDGHAPGVAWCERVPRRRSPPRYRRQHDATDAPRNGSHVRHRAGRPGDRACAGLPGLQGRCVVRQCLEQGRAPRHPR